MGSQLFSWMLAAGLFGLLWMFYLSIIEDDTHRKPAARLTRRHGKPGH